MLPQKILYALRTQALRNLVSTILRLAGAAGIAVALRYHARRPGRPLQTIMQC
jgi:hypothetical protein